MSEIEIGQRRARRNKSVRVRLSAAEFCALTAFATDAALPTSEVLRRLAREASGLGPTFEGDMSKKIQLIIVQLRKIGVNLNQIARVLNSGSTPGYEPLLGGIERLARLVAQHERDLDELRARGRARALRLVRTDV
ncbi:plasmid mobilization relaxosome protein MobC [Rhizobium rhizogenes]|uniref:Bacterial mobilisation domain-containing protein n=1 Tax=Rhizobium rhizogenes (strain K84 / ATCC BAA-868) TaxID=311403 RepID=B9JPQ2_RHIR8|nr:hypothetical protein Arad_12040 [Rhizobium rhizogenes K84]NTG77881.1 MobC family plasmid mobilization relaxosome protein [Rhizobium rhizogenes]